MFMPTQMLISKALDLFTDITNLQISIEGFTDGEDLGISTAVDDPSELNIDPSQFYI